ALAGRYEDAVDGRDAAAGVGDAQTVLVVPDQGEAIDLHRHTGVFLFGQIDVYRGRPLTADVGHAFLESVVLALAQAGDDLQFYLRAFRQRGRRSGRHWQALSERREMRTV